MGKYRDSTQKIIRRIGKMNSKWQAHRVGLIDFWYYDEEEFYFVDGRMLLRGSNGSGKSVTMQSFIPLLLDGNMRPERLDPFGSKARKMENYLLEEDDDREERTGYLFMEFKRLDSDFFLTIGIGMRARRNKKLDTWYFYINDGRRIGKDIFLYKDLKSKIAYSKQELKNRIGEGGKIIDRQAEYMETVNRLIFGFETIEEYKELVDLLIQLRTPKLSKDFKPTVINEILGSSLAPLSEDDLRPMSEAIENMDNLKTNLDTLKQSHEAAKKISRVYDRYNQYMMFTKAQYYKESRDKYRQLNKELAQIEEGIVFSKQEYQQQKNRYQELKQEESVIKDEIDTLNSSDARTLKEKEERFLEEKQLLMNRMEEKESAIEIKKDKRIEIENRAKKKQEESEQIFNDIEEGFNNMEDCFETVSFDDFVFLRQELVQNKGSEYNFTMHNKLVQQLSEDIEEGIDHLKEEGVHKRAYELSVDNLEKRRSEWNTKEKERLQYENQLFEIRSELIENIYNWEQKNKELKLSKELLQKMTLEVEQFQDGSDYNEIKEYAREIQQQIEDSLRHVKNKEVMKAQQRQEELQSYIEELKYWEDMEEPEPPQTVEIANNRKVLQDMGIQYQELYKVIDFAEGISEEKKNAVEEALLKMNLLDALIVDIEDKDKILSLDQGLCDRYIFSDVSSVKDNISGILEIDDPNNDILLYQKISKVLSMISYEGIHHTAIDEHGNYQLGIIYGTITGSYQSKYIGRKARQRYRQEQIQELNQTVIKAREALEEQQHVVEEIQLRIQHLMEDLHEFPSGNDLIVAAKEHQRAKDVEGQIYHEVRNLENQLKKEEEILIELRQKVLHISKKLDLTGRLDVFVQAKEDIYEYKQYLTEVQINYAKYGETLIVIESLSSQLEDVDADLDGLLYDLHSFSASLRKVKMNLESIQEQLSLTNYKEIKERLDYCVKRSKEIPGEMEETIRKERDSYNQLQRGEEKKSDLLLEMMTQRTKKEKGKRIFLEESRLAYTVPFGKNEEEEIDKFCLQIISQYGSTFGNKRLEDLTNDLQNVFHMNRGMLVDFMLSLDSLFVEETAQDEEGITIRRIDIVGQYRGVTIKFHELVYKIGLDIEEQTLILNDQDRELFEDILANTISKKIRAKIYSGNAWVKKMNELMNQMVTSSGLKLSLRWKSKRAEHENQLDTSELVTLLKKDADLMTPTEYRKMSEHFRSKIQEARQELDDTNTQKSFHMLMKEILDYRMWFEFQLESQKSGERKKELTDRVFFTFSGGEKAMAMYVPLFSAVVAKYDGARNDAPRLISLDEAFAGVDELNIKDMFRLMVELEFDFMINSQILWGDYETVPSLAIYELIRPENVKYVTVISYIWNGIQRMLKDGRNKRTQS